MNESEREIIPDKGGAPGFGRDELDNAEARARIEKVALEQEKLRLESRALRRQLSLHGLLLEWMKAATVPAAVLGVLVTYIIGTWQFRETEEGRAADRFDKALSRLATPDNALARMTGVAGLRQFLADGKDEHQLEAVRYLVTTIAQEKTAEVRKAVLDAFSDAGHFNQQSKDDALRVAVELNRSLTEQASRQIQSTRFNRSQELNNKIQGSFIRSVHRICARRRT